MKKKPPITFKCDHCGTPKTVRPGRYKPEQKNHFCSTGCATAFRMQATNTVVSCSHCGCDFTLKKCDLRSRLLSSPNNQLFCSKKCYGESKRTRKTVACTNCGKETTTKPCDIKRKTRNWAFCSKQCFYDYQKSITKVEVTCEECDKIFQRYPTSKKEKNYCSPKCYWDWFYKNPKTSKESMREKYRANNSRYANKQWRWIRITRLEIDNYMCQECGVHQIELKTTLHVHHIIPIILFDRIKDAHQLSNLISLCASCHKKAEKKQLV